MDRSERTTSRRRRVLGSGIAFLLLCLAVGPAAAACTASREPGTAGTAPSMPSMTTDSGAAAPAAPAVAQLPPGVVRVDAAKMWAVRPDFVRADPTTATAYRYALEHPEVIAWMPCYCGCDAMDHRSNLDCYLKPNGTNFEEHASYCDVCVQITLKAKDLVAQGKTLREVRAAVDATWGGGAAPGTRTALPPA